MAAIKKRRRTPNQIERDRLDRQLDKALADSFPASDPIALNVDEPPSDDVVNDANGHRRP